MRRITGSFLALLFILALLPATAAANGVTWTRVATLTVPGGMGDPYGVAVDKWGYAYAASEPSSALYTFDPSGAYTGSWGSSGTAVGQLSKPWPVECDRYGRVYVGERGNRRITAFWRGMDPTQASIIGSSGPNPWNIFNPLGLSVALGQDVFMVDNADTVIVFDKYLGPKNWWDPSLAEAIGAHVDQDGNVWIAADQAFPAGGRPQYGNSVLKHSPDGTLLASWGGTSTAFPPTPGLFNRPYDVAVDGGGRVFVAESGAGQVQVFDGAGTFQSAFGYLQMSAPFSVAAGFDRRVYVAETYGQKVTVWEQTPTVATVETQVAGLNRYATAAAASAKAYPDGSDWVVVASGTNWPDALGGASLCGALGAPLLLTYPTALSPETAAEITRLGASHAYVLGGTGAVSDPVLSDIEDLVHSDVPRLGGLNRYATAALIASETISVVGSDYYDGTAFVCTGKDFPDALAAAPIAAANRWPIYLTEPTTYTAATRAGMLANLAQHGYVIGGTAAVSDAVVDAIEAASPLPFDGFGRLAGANRYSTAATLAAVGYTGMGLLWSRPAVATGQNFADALAGGVLQGSDYSVMLLTPTNSLDPAAAALLTENRDMIYEMRFLGGTGAVSAPVRTAVMDSLL